MSEDASAKNIAKTAPKSNDDAGGSKKPAPPDSGTGADKADAGDVLKVVDPKSGP